MKKINFLFFGLSMFFLLASFSSVYAQKKQNKKKRIAVFLFDDKSDSNWQWYGSKSVGEGISDMVVTELVKTGDYRVIEREQLNKLLAEQDLGQSGIVTPESAAAVGKVLGVELAVFGAVTEFGYKRGDTGVRLGGTKVGVGKQSAVAGIDIRLVNTSTGEIILAENVTETKSALAGSFSKGRVSFDNRKSFDESLVGKVTRRAVEKVIRLIDDNAVNVPWQAKVITMQGSQVYINSGSQDGVKVGDVFTVFKKGEALIDPDTGLNLGTIDTEAGQIKVTDNTVGEGKASICTVLSGSGFQKGDLVKDK